LSTPSIIS